MMTEVPVQEIEIGNRTELKSESETSVVTCVFDFVRGT